MKQSCLHVSKQQDADLSNTALPAKKEDIPTDHSECGSVDFPLVYFRPWYLVDTSNQSMTICKIKAWTGSIYFSPCQVKLLTTKHVDIFYSFICLYYSMSDLPQQLHGHLNSVCLPSHHWRTDLPPIIHTEK